MIYQYAASRLETALFYRDLAAVPSCLSTPLVLNRAGAALVRVPNGTHTFQLASVFTGR